jgi:homoserine kinase
MRKVTVRLPATITHLGPGIRGLGLAVGLYATVEISERADNQLIVDTAGEGAGSYSIGLRHPVVLAMLRVFQLQERAPLGIQVRVTNAIPVRHGLGAEAAFWVAGVIGANNLLGLSLSREAILRLSAQICPHPDNAVCALLGGLTSSLTTPDQLIYRPHALTSFRLVLAVPDIDSPPGPAPESISLAAALANIRRLPLLLEGFRSGDLTLIGQVLEDQIERQQQRIPGYNHIRESARQAGAAGFGVCGEGPAVMAFAHRDHQAVADAMVAAFQNMDVAARAWVVPIDTQGVVISAMQSS